MVLMMMMVKLTMVVVMVLIMMGAVGGVRSGFGTVAFSVAAVAVAASVANVAAAAAAAAAIFSYDSYIRSCDRTTNIIFCMIVVNGIIVFVSGITSLAVVVFTVVRARVCLCRRCRC